MLHHPDEAQEIHAIRVATRNFNSLKGWVPASTGIGLLWFMTARSLERGGAAQGWAFLGTIGAWSLAWLYYRRAYGVVKRSPEHRRLETRYVLLFILGWWLTMVPSALGWHPPVDLTLLVTGAGLLTWWALQYRETEGLEHHVVASIGLMILSLAPSVVSNRIAYYRDTSMDLYLVAIGVSLIVTGVLDHAFLVRTLRRPIRPHAPAPMPLLPPGRRSVPAWAHG